MLTQSTIIEDVYLIRADLHPDDRGSFATYFNIADLFIAGMPFIMERCSSALNYKTATWRGLHYQMAPFEEVKLVTCIKGGILDIIVDIRPNSKTYKQWVGIGLSELNRDVVYVPKGCAHGYLTVVPNTEVLYCISSPYRPDLQRGIRYDDPSFDIRLPVVPSIISQKDQSHPDFKG